MKQKINGWDVLESELKRVSGIEKIVAELFGDGFEIETIADGTYLLNSDEVEELLQKLDMPQKTRITFFKFDNHRQDPLRYNSRYRIISKTFPPDSKRFRNRNSLS